MIDPKQVEKIVSCLKVGGVIALPTETIYGLCCDPRNEEAVGRLFQIKQRDPSKAVLCVTGRREHINKIAEIPSSFEPIARAFWPGPLTVIFPLKTSVNLSPLTLHEGTIALRLSPDPLIQEITQLLESPIVATSANISGQPFLQDAYDVKRVFGDQLNLIIETDHPLLQTPSTLISYTKNGTVSLVREGAIPWTDIQTVLET